MKSYYLREEYKQLRSPDGRGFLPDPYLMFKWAMIAPGKYLVIKPKTFRKEVGDTVTVMSSREFERFFRVLNEEAK